jgi:hypothetical protein
VCLTEFRRKASQANLAYAKQRKDLDGFSEEEVLRALRPELFDWKDPGAYTFSYQEIVDGSNSAVQYTRQVNMSKAKGPFPLKEWVDLHRPVCQVCQDHWARHGGIEGFLRHNDRNQCPLADVLCWLSGEWRIPLASIPPKASLENYPSLYFDIPAITKEIQRMKEWGTIVRGEAHLVHPVMGVVKDSDVREVCRILSAIGRPSPSEDKKDVALINEHINQILEEGVPIPPHLGELKPIPVRLCVDCSKLLNDRVQDWKFSFAKVHDFVRLLGKGSWMARIDAQKYFNQLPLHPDDWGMLGIRLPKDLHYMEKDLEEWISAYAQFGGKPFPAYANAVMAAICFILRAHGIECVFMTDDIGICASSKEECEALLAKAVGIIRRLGVKIQDLKIIHPAQVMPFLGILIDTLNMRLSIPREKLESILRFIQHLLECHEGNTLLAKDLESLLGKLGWIVEVMIAGKAHLRALRKSLPSWWFHHRHVSATITLGEEAREDLHWWIAFIQQAADHPFWVPFWTHSSPTHCRVFSDASGEMGFGMALGKQVYQGLWSPEALPQSSGYKELIPVLLALQRLYPEASGKIVVVTTDNLGNVFAINKGICRSAESQIILEAIMELAAEKRIYLVADWCPRETNEYMDTVSKELWGEEADISVLI